MSVSFADRTSARIARFGYVQVSSLLLEHMAELGLTPHKLAYLLVVMNKARGSWPVLSAADVASATGAGERSVKDWRRALVKDGLLVLRRRGLAGGGTDAATHDLTPLYARLEAIAALQPVDDLPAARFPAVAPVAAARRLDSRRASPQRHPSNMQKSVTSSTDERAGSGPFVGGTKVQKSVTSWAHERAGSGPFVDAPLLTRTEGVTTEGVRTEKPGSALAARALAPGLTPVPLGGQDGVDDGPPTVLVDDRPAAAEIVYELWRRDDRTGQLAHELLRDDDPTHTARTVQRWCWITGLEPVEVGRLMREAFYETTGPRRMAARNKPAAYWLTYLKSLMGRRCEALGLPTPNWRPTSDDRRRHLERLQDAYAELLEAGERDPDVDPSMRLMADEIRRLEREVFAPAAARG